MFCPPEWREPYPKNYADYRGPSTPFSLRLTSLRMTTKRKNVRSARLNRPLKNSNRTARRTEVRLAATKIKGLIGTAEAVP